MQGEYSHRLRTALVLTGTGTAGAYHAGVLRAVQESSVRLDLVAGDGIGAVGALFAAADGAAALWESGGIWQSPHVRQFYRRRTGVRFGTAPGRGVGPSGSRRRAREPLWRRVLGPPLECDRTIDLLTAKFWALVSGEAAAPRAPSAEIGARGVELVLENLGQLGFRELLIVVHDLDAQRDLVFALLGDARRREFFAPRDVDPARRGSEAFDLTGGLREKAVDVAMSGLRVPLVTDPQLLGFPVNSWWRGESHHIVHRPGSIVRLVEEVDRAGAEQIIVVSASPEPIGPHSLRTPRTDRLGRFGEHVMSGEAAALREVEGGRHRARIFIIRPTHNPLGPFDFAGAYDERSDRRHALDELMQRGYEDAVRHLIDSSQPSAVSSQLG